MLKRAIAPRVADEAFAQGLLINAPRPDTLRFMPALTVGDREIDRMIAILDGVMTACTSPEEHQIETKRSEGCETSSTAAAILPK